MALLRFMAAILAFSISWILIVMPAVFLVHPPVAIVLHFFGADPFTLRVVIEFFAILGGLLFVAHTALFPFVSLVNLIKHISHPYPCEKLDKQHPLHQEVAELARAAGISAPSVFISGLPALNAFAIAIPFRRAVVITSALLEALPPPHRRWVLGHELAHLKFDDAYAGGYWTVMVRATNSAKLLRYAILRGLFAVVGRIPVINILASIAIFPILAALYLISFAEAVSRYIFLAMDRWIGREMEYRADALGAQLSSKQAGLETLQYLSGGIEPSWNGLLATHPTTRARLQRLEDATGPEG